MHSNSLEAYKTKEKALGGKKKLIYDWMMRNKEYAHTDKHIAMLMGYKHHSAVQPRLSDLIKEGWVYEAGSQRDLTTGVRCRMLQPRTKEQRDAWILKGQLELKL